MRLREPTLALLFLIPAFIALGVFLYYPIAQTFIYSLYNLRYTTELSPEAFYGLNNYIDVFNSGRFWSSLVHRQDENDWWILFTSPLPNLRFSLPSPYGEGKTSGASRGEVS